MNLRGNKLIKFIFLLNFIIVGVLWSAPYHGSKTRFQQPDGTIVDIYIYGDEYYAQFQSVDGKLLTRDPKTGFLSYAVLNSEKTELISTGVKYTGVESLLKSKSSGQDPSPKKVEGLNPSKVLEIRKEGKKQFEDLKKGNGIQINRNNLQNSISLNEPSSLTPSSISSTAPSSLTPFSIAPVQGQVIGLTLIIEFPDVKSQITRQQVFDLLNQTGYTGFQNNGSVKDYFFDISRGKLTYTNLVPPVFYTAKNKRSYYTDPLVRYGVRAQELIQEALTHLVSTGFNFSSLSKDANNNIKALNVFYAGFIENSWREGLWPHQWGFMSSYTITTGVNAKLYQISNLDNDPSIGTFVHESGHLVLDLPDLYDYGGNSQGTGNYCLMSSAFAKNPVPLNPYFTWKLGWGNVLEMPQQRGILGASEFANDNTYRILKNPKFPQEFFMIDQVDRTRRTQNMPDAGLIIWHIDESKLDNEDENMTPLNHYMVSVEQADGLFDLERNRNSGNVGDLFRFSGRSEFYPYSTPGSNWWDGTSSGLWLKVNGDIGSENRFEYYTNHCLPFGGVVDDQTGYCVDKGADLTFWTKAKNVFMNYQQTV